MIKDAILIFGIIVLALMGASLLGYTPVSFRLPGDIFIRRGNIVFYFPIGLSIALSILLSLFIALFTGSRKK